VQGYPESETRTLTIDHTDNSTDPFNGELAALYDQIELVQNELKAISAKALHISNLAGSIKQRAINLALNTTSEKN
jgi:hypothetical protein